MVKEDHTSTNSAISPRLTWRASQILANIVRLTFSPRLIFRMVVSLIQARFTNSFLVIFLLSRIAQSLL